MLEALESGRIGRRTHGQSGGAPPRSAASEQETDNLIPASFSAGTGLGVVDADNEIELSMLREERTEEGDDVLRLEPWVNQVSADLSVLSSTDLTQCFML